MADQQAQKTLEEKFVKVGPKGSLIPATNFDFQPTDAAFRLKKVGMMAAWAIGTFEVEYENTASSPAETYRLGPVGSGGGQRVEFSIEPGDYLTKISATWGSCAPGYHKEDIITLQFETYKGVKSPVFGGGSGKQETEPFVLEAPEGTEIIGFFGAYGGPQDLIEQLGIYCQPVATTSQPQPEPEPETTVTPQVEITNIFYKGEVKRTQSDEYVEITNQENKPADISGWQISSGVGRNKFFTFPAETKLAAGQKIRVYTNEVHPESGGFTCGSKLPLWKDTGDEARLLDAKGNWVSGLAYDSKGNFTRTKTAS